MRWMNLPLKMPAFSPCSIQAAAILAGDVSEEEDDEGQEATSFRVPF